MSQEFDEICQLIWNLLIKLQTNWKISLSFCSLLRKPELYEESKTYKTLPTFSCFNALYFITTNRALTRTKWHARKNDSFNFLKKLIRDMFFQDNVLGQLELVFPGFENLRKSLAAL